MFYLFFDFYRLGYRIGNGFFIISLVQVFVNYNYSNKGREIPYKYADRLLVISIVIMFIFITFFIRPMISFDRR